MRARPVLAAAIIYAALSLLFVSPGLMPGRTMSGSDFLWSQAPWSSERPAGVPPLGANFELSDAANAYEPWVAYTRSQLPRVPLWNPQISNGRPFVGNAQSAVFSPYSVPVYVLGLLTALPLIAAFKLFVAAFGTFLLGRALGMRFGGAFLSGLAFGFNILLVGWLFATVASVWTVLPWLLLTTDMVVRRPGKLSIAALATAVGIQFVCGHPESSFYVLVGTVAFAALRIVQGRRGGLSWARLRRSVVGMLAALALGAALAALALLPFLELTRHSSDVQFRGAFAGNLEGRFLLGMFLPEYWGRPTKVIVAPFLYARTLYVGVLPLLLAFAAVILRPRFERLAIAAFAAVSLAVVFGAPGLTDVVRVLPVFSKASLERGAILPVLCIALLAGWGLDELTRLAVPASRLRMALWTGGVVLLLPVLIVGIASPSTWGHAIGVAVARTVPPDPASHESTKAILHFAALLTWLVFGGACVALVISRIRGHLAAASFVAIASCLVTLDLFHIGVGLYPAIPRGTATPPATAAIRYLQTHSGARFAGISAGGNEFLGANTLSPDNAMRYGLSDARGYDFPVERRYDRLWALIRPRGGKLDDYLPRDLLPIAGDETPLGSLLATMRQQSLSLMSVRYVLVPPRAPPVWGGRLVYTGRDGRIYANDYALPRAYVVDRQTVVTGGDSALRETVRLGFDTWHVGVTEERVAGVATVAAGSSSGERGIPRSAEITTSEPNRVTIGASVAAPSLLILTDTFYPGWKAKVDGKPVPIRRVNYLFRAVALAPGAHAVEFRYEPTSWAIGWRLSFAAAACLVLMVVTAVRRRRLFRRHGPVSTPPHPVSAAGLSE